jgi:hypothetical protein
MYKTFLNEKFLCLNVLSGDDKFLTRWVINNGYKTYHQLMHDCELSTPFEKGVRLFQQFIRWSRNTWRSDFNCMFIERKVWKNNPYTAFVMFDKIFTPFLMIGGLVYTFVLCFTHKPLITVNVLPKAYGTTKDGFDYPLFIGYMIWLLISRTLKLYYYLWEFPHHIVYIPMFIFFQYVQALIRLYALVTLYERGWGTRKIEVKGNEIVRSMPVAATVVTAPSVQMVSSEQNTQAEDAISPSQVTPVIRDIVAHEISNDSSLSAPNLEEFYHTP